MSIFPAVRPAVSPAVRGAFEQGSGGGAASIIAGLFAQGQQGFWLPFTDFASLSQDSAGTLPYTAVERPVGLILDKSKGGGRGPELSPNGGTFDDAAGWTITQPTSSISGGVLNVGAGACDIFPQTASVVVGKSYEVTFTISNSTANYGIRILNRDIIGTGNYFPAGSLYITANGSYRVVCVALSNGSIGVNRVIGHTGSLQVDNFSVKEILGNHASQPTSTARGVVSARVNLLTKTEQFGDAVWTPTNITPTLGQSGISGVAPVAVRLTPTTANGTHGFKAFFVSGRNGATHSVYLKADGYSKVGFKESITSGLFAAFDLSSATLLASSPGSLPTIQSLDGGWCRISFSPVTVNAGQSFDIRVLSPAYTSGDTNASTFVGDGVSGVLMCGPQMEKGLTATTYQRVTPTDYDAVGFPKFLLLDGTDDYYTCGGGGSTTGFFYSDVVLPTTSTFSALLDDTTAGGGYLVQRTNTGIHFSAKAGGVATAVSLPLAANVQAFVLAMDDGVTLTLQVNSAQVSVARPVVTAGSSTMYLGRYTALAQYFSGTMTEPIYRAGPPPNAYERDVIRNYQMQKAGML